MIFTRPTVVNVRALERVGITWNEPKGAGSMKTGRSAKVTRLGRDGSFRFHLEFLCLVVSCQGTDKSVK